MAGNNTNRRVKSKAVVKKQAHGRPTKITPAVETKLVAAFANGFTVTEACMYAEISRETFYNRAERDERFRDKMQVAQQQPTMKAKQVVVASINADDIETAKWWLKNKASAEFGGNAAAAQNITNNFLVVAKDDLNAFSTPNAI